MLDYQINNGLYSVLKHDEHVANLLTDIDHLFW